MKKKLRILYFQPMERKLNVFSLVRTSMFNLATLILAEIARKKGYKHEAFAKPIFVEALLSKEERRELAKLFAENCDILAASAYDSNIKTVYELFKEVKRFNPSLITVIGGPRVGYVPEEALFQKTDIVVRAEGEETWSELLEKLHFHKFSNSKPTLKESLADVSGISFRNSDGFCVHNPDRPPIENLDEYPAPNLDLVYKYNRERGRALPATTSRGCPYRCYFCNEWKRLGGGKYRYRSPDYVFKNVLRIIEGINNPKIFFFDNNFVAKKKKHTIPLLEKIIKLRESGTNLTFTCQVRVETAADEEFMELMAKAGCTRVFVGVESLNAETLKEFKKGITLKQITKSFEVCRKLGIEYHAMTIFGSDSNKPETLRNLIESLERFGEHISLQICALIALDATGQAEQWQREQRVFNPDLDCRDGQYITHWPNNMTPFQAQLAITRDYLHYYRLRLTIPQTIKAYAEFIQEKGLIYTIRNIHKPLFENNIRLLLRYYAWGITLWWAIINVSYFVHLWWISRNYIPPHNPISKE